MEQYLDFLLDPNWEKMTAGLNLDLDLVIHLGKLKEPLMVLQRDLSLVHCLVNLMDYQTAIRLAYWTVQSWAN